MRQRLLVTPCEEIPLRRLVIVVRAVKGNARPRAIDELFESFHQNGLLPHTLSQKVQQCVRVNGLNQLQSREVLIEKRQVFHLRITALALQV